MPDQLLQPRFVIDRVELGLNRFCFGAETRDQEFHQRRARALGNQFLKYR